MADSWEARYMPTLNPTNSSDHGEDPDGDGLINFWEMCYNGNPTNSDTDAGGKTDGNEVPHSPGSAIDVTEDLDNPTNCVTIPILLWDDSTTKSEYMRMEIGAGPQYWLVNTNHGVVCSTNYSFPKGTQYQFKVVWFATSSNEYDYDYVAQIGGWPDAGATENGDHADWYVSTNGFVIHDPEGILGTWRDCGPTGGVSNAFANKDKTGTLYIPKVQLMEVGFSGSGEHTLKKTGNDTWTNDTYVSEGNTTITDPVWKDANLDGDVEDAGDTDDPVCFTRKSSPTIQAKFKVSPGLTLTGVPFSATLHAGTVSTLNYSTNVNISGDEVSVTLTTADQLPDEVFNGTWTIDFTCDIAGLTGVDAGSSEHKAFITYATPKNTYFDITDNYNPVSMALTAKRVNIASQWANTKATTNDIADACDDGVGSTLGFAYNYTNNPFAALDVGTGWDCISWGNVAATGCRLLGIEAHPYRAWCRNNIVTNDSTTWGWQVQYHMYRYPGSGETSWFLGYEDNNFQGFFYVGTLDISGGIFPSDGWTVGTHVPAISGKEKYLPISILNSVPATAGVLFWFISGGGTGGYCEWKPGSSLAGISIQPYPASYMDDPASDGTFDLTWTTGPKELQFNGGTAVTITTNGTYQIPSSIADLLVDVSTNSLPATNATGKVRVVLPHEMAPIP